MHYPYTVVKPYGIAHGDLQMTIVVLSHHDCARHENPPGHPERRERTWAIDDRLIASALNLATRHEDAPPATREQLLRVHDAAYVDEVFALSPDQGLVELDGDTTMSPGTLQASLRAAGAAVRAVDLVMAHAVHAVFCNVRPPGHHAERARAMGFCIFNNVAVGAAHALAEYGLERVAIVDFDVHHGNGTEEIFRDESRVLLCSTFQHPFYPHTGADTVSDHIVNVPLPAATKGPQYRAAFSERVLPALDSFRPQLVMFSAGFDAHCEDEMSMVCLREDDYRWLTREVKAIADRHAEGRMVSCLEGGYSLSALGRSAGAHIDAMLD
jgi:acetoin utilization deacetylase AcuC-like enzyme